MAVSNRSPMPTEFKLRQLAKGLLKKNGRPFQKASDMLEAAAKWWCSKSIEVPQQDDTTPTTPQTITPSSTTSSTGTPPPNIRPTTGGHNSNHNVNIYVNVSIGNIVEQQIYAKGKPCSSCPAGYRCNDALCSRK
ncbi:hypothetical protein Q1695_010988 [Nippostrongylus brasiliensis]|nr:hypothetical protein Q1695_010988 [Nippostrongylus brasiliensis]